MKSIASICTRCIRTMSMRLDELIPQLKSCGYECEAGKLECNIAFRQVSHIIERLDYILGNGD